MFYFYSIVGVILHGVIDDQTLFSLVYSTLVTSDTDVPGADQTR